MSAAPTEYRVLSTTDLGRLEDLASKALKANWKMQGGVAATASNHGYTFYQAMTRAYPESP